MRITELPFRFPPDTPRSGVHLSDIIKDILKLKNPSIYGRPITDQSRAKFEVGYMVEDVIKMRGLWGPRVQRQVEFKSDGIICTLDGLCPACDKVYESKGTFYSMREGILRPDLIHYKWQLCSYCHVSRCNAGILDVWWMNGNYSPLQTTVKRYLWEFSERERLGTWTMIRRHRDRMAKEGRLPNA